MGSVPFLQGYGVCGAPGCPGHPIVDSKMGQCSETVGKDVDPRFVDEVRRVAGLISVADRLIGSMIYEHVEELGAAMAQAYPGYFAAVRCNRAWPTAQCALRDGHEGLCTVNPPRRTSPH